MERVACLFLLVAGLSCGGPAPAGLADAADLAGIRDLGIDPFRIDPGLGMEILEASVVDPGRDPTPDADTGFETAPADAPPDPVSPLDLGMDSGTDAAACSLPLPAGPFPVPASWPAPNAWSWNGSWEPAAEDFPIPGLFDDEYHDGHPLDGGSPSDILPPGRWDWNDADNDCANWRNFDTNLGRFEKLLDACGRQYGWRFVANTPGDVDWAGPAEYFEGSPGTDLLYLGAGGAMHSITAGLGDGPDVVVFDRGWSLDLYVGSSLRGAAHDDDLVVAGCTVETDGTYGIQSASIHTGPGRDLVFARDLKGAAIDAGNGDGGTTSVVDPADGDDVVCYHGNMKDFRFFGGNGDDVAVWYVDEMKEKTPFFGPNFFGGGGAGDAIWGDAGTDRLVLVIPPDTVFVSKTETPPGALLLRRIEDEPIWWDEPVYDDPHARYCITCGVGPGDRRTLNLEYRSKDDTVFTGYFYVTAFEELQLGIGPNARVFRLDDVVGTATPAPDLAPFEPPEMPWALCEIVPK